MIGPPAGGRGTFPLVLDNEAVQALQDSRHRQHKHAIALVEAVRARDRGQLRRAPLVPTAVRVEAGWDRRSPDAAAINRLRIVDIPLDAVATNRAAVLVNALGLSVADAHLGATVAAVGSACTVLTSDVDDVRRIAAHLDAAVTVVAL